MPSVRSVILAAASAGVAMAETIIVKVGQEGTTFDPQMVTAAAGDIVEFQFWPQNHSVVAGDMDKGCTPLADDGFFSGFMPVDEGKGETAFQVEINGTAPWVFYCSQAKHCQNGMYGMINGNDTALEAYMSLATDASANESPDSTDAFGGSVVTASETDSSDNSTDTEEGGAGVVAASMGMSFAAFAAAVLLS
ncbi:extracellular serine-rich protein [Zalerion maritima]|uniref:Extracellular serine-rich protein n=1 Tax=Zalerion maritima TaxID=339359 RepID=A0AAD5RIQ4_9PEZI|nr:extracellular serine-rich protein [Zalerion maritima]